MLIRLMVSVLFVIGTLGAQDPSSSSQDTRFQEAKTKFARFDLEGARPILEQMWKNEILRSARRIEISKMLAAVAEHQGRKNDAVNWCQQTVGTIRSQPGLGQEALARALETLGTTAQRMGQSDLAFRSLREALELTRTELPAYKEATKRRLFVYARAAIAARKWELGRDIYVRYLAHLEKAKGLTDPDLDFPLARLANLENRLGHPEAALSYHRRWIALQETLKRKNDPTICRVLAKTWRLEMGLGHIDLARADAMRWRSIVGKVSKDHPGLVDADLALAQIADKEGKPVEALGYLDSAKAQARRILGRSSSKVASIERRRATGLRALKKYDEALVAIESCLEIHGRRKKKGDLVVLDARLERARVHRDRSDWIKAKNDAAFVLKGFEKIGGEEHALLIKPLSVLEECALAEGQTELAARLAARRTKVLAQQEKRRAPKSSPPSSRPATKPIDKR